jgi:hypothetical protein
MEGARKAVYLGEYVSVTANRGTEHGVSQEVNRLSFSHTRDGVSFHLAHDNERVEWPVEPLAEDWRESAGIQHFGAVSGKRSCWFFKKGQY